MTPLQIDILLWYYTRAVDYRDGDLSAPAVREAIDSFRDRSNMLEPVSRAGPGDFRSYQLTDRARAYVQALMSLPLPICQWTIPGAPISVPADSYWQNQAEAEGRAPSNPAKEG